VEYGKDDKRKLVVSNLEENIEVERLMKRKLEIESLKVLRLEY
jgi:hypothetical protein